MAIKWLEHVMLAMTSMLHVAVCRTLLRPRRPACTASDSDAILVIRCEAKLGDSLLHLPFLRCLRRAFPDRPIHLLHHRATRAIYAACPYVDRRIEFDWEPSSVASVLRRLGAVQRVFATLEPHVDYTVAISSRWDQDLYAPFFAWFSGAPLRIGFSRHVNANKAINCLGTDGLYTGLSNDRAPCHEAQRPLALLGLLGQHCADGAELEYRFSDEDRAHAGALLEESGPGPWIAIAPGAALERRQWPAERFVAVGAALAARFGVRIALLGSPGERGLCERVAATLGDAATNVAGALSMSQCAAVLARCRLLVGNDSGLAHLASAVALPVVEVSCQPIGASPLGSNAPERFGPTSLGSIVLQPGMPAAPSCADGCLSQHAHCIDGVSAETVLAAASRLLESSAAQVSGSSPSALDLTLPHVAR